MANYADAVIEWSDNTSTLLDLVKQILDICDNDTSRDDELSLFIQMAGQACEKYIDNKLVSQEVTEKFSHSRTPIALRYWPAGSLVSVIKDGDDVTADWEVFTDDGIQWAVRDRSGSSVSCSFDQLDILYNCGYDPLPADLAYAIARTSLGYEQNGATGEVKRESIVGVGSIDYATSADDVGAEGMLSASTVDTLNLYRHWRV